MKTAFFLMALCLGCLGAGAQDSGSPEPGKSRLLKSIEEWKVFVPDQGALMQKYLFGPPLGLHQIKEEALSAKSAAEIKKCQLEFEAWQKDLLEGLRKASPEKWNASSEAELQDMAAQRLKGINPELGALKNPQENSLNVVFDNNKRDARALLDPVKEPVKPEDESLDDKLQRLINHEEPLSKYCLIPPDLNDAAIERLAKYLMDTELKWNRPKISMDKLKSLMKLVARKSRQYEVDPLLIMALITLESQCKPKLKSPSSAGGFDMGLMQVHPNTARGMPVHEKSKVKSLLDPEHNLDVGMTFFKEVCWKRFAKIPFSALNCMEDPYQHLSIRLSIGAYNAGKGNVEKYVKGYLGSNGEMPKDSEIPKNKMKKFKTAKNYVRRILERYRNFRQLLTQTPKP